MAPFRSLFAFLLTLGATSAFTPAKPSAKVTRYGTFGSHSRKQSTTERWWCSMLHHLSCSIDNEWVFSVIFGKRKDPCDYVPVLFSPFYRSLSIYSVSASSGLTPPGVYEDAVADWEKQFPQFAKYGWGPSVQAEKWNGRHAMFGWFFICATAYCKGHGLIPDPDMALDFKEWGTLATISGKNTITNERALILIANAHFFGVSLMATICPPAFGDSLLVDPNHPRYEEMKALNEKGGFGYLPELKFGLTEEAEIVNGRLAMLGLMALLVTTVIEQKPIVSVSRLCYAATLCLCCIYRL